MRANRSDNLQLCFLSIQIEHLHESGREYSGKNSNQAHCELEEPLRHLHATRTRHSLSVVHGERELLFALAGTHPLQQNPREWNWEIDPDMSILKSRLARLSCTIHTR